MLQSNKEDYQKVQSVFIKEFCDSEIAGTVEREEKCNGKLRRIAIETKQRRLIACCNVYKSQHS